MARTPDDYYPGSLADVSRYPTTDPSVDTFHDRLGPFDADPFTTFRNRRPAPRGYPIEPGESERFGDPSKVISQGEDQTPYRVAGTLKVPRGTITTIEKAPLQTPMAERGGLAGGAGGDEGLRQARLEAERRAGGRVPLPGLPTEAQTVEGRPFVPGPVGRVHDVADRYMAGRNFGVAQPDKFYPLDKDRARAIAKAYDELPLYDPAARQAYEAMIRETLGQYQAIRNSGLKISPVGAENYPYGSNPRAVAQDVGDRGHMAFFKTEPEAGAFGTGGEANIAKSHPLLTPSGEYVGDYPMLNNDLFRVVHDYFGHIKHGFGFRAAGEDNAWRSHAGMYSPEARPAMTSETRGQNSWVNYGPHGDFNRIASGADTIYSPQKVAVMPAWTMDDLKKLGLVGGGVMGGLAAMPGEAEAAGAKPPGPPKPPVATSDLTAKVIERIANDPAYAKLASEPALRPLDQRRLAKAAERGDQTLREADFALGPQPSPEAFRKWALRRIAPAGALAALPNEGAQAKEALPPGTLAAQNNYRPPAADPIRPMPRLPSRAPAAAEDFAAGMFPVKDLSDLLRGTLTEDEARTMAVTGGIGALAPMKAPRLKAGGAEGASGAPGALLDPRKQQILTRPPLVAPTPQQTLFDYSRIHEVPDVPQFDLQRYNPKHGVSERVQDLIKNKDVERQMLEMFERGRGMNAETFYYNEPLREAFVAEFGKDKGPAQFARYMDYVAGSSPRSKVPENARNASYYYMLEQQGLPVPAKGGKNPQPYGHMAQNLHRGNAANIRSGEYFDLFDNPKPLSFSQNLQGNFSPIAVDAHAFNLPAMLARDPRFLATSIKPGKGLPSVYPQKLFQSGEMSMDEMLRRPAYWAGVPNKNEYAAMEQYYKNLAREAALAPAQGQAAGWAGGGHITGLKSAPGEPFMRAVEDRAILTAQDRGITPQEALSQMMRGKAPLIGFGGAALGMGGFAAQDRYE